MPEQILARGARIPGSPAVTCSRPRARSRLACSSVDMDAWRRPAATRRLRLESRPAIPRRMVSCCGRVWRCNLWHPTPRAVLAAPVTVTWEIATDDIMRHVVQSGTVEADRRWAYSVHMSRSEVSRPTAATGTASPRLAHKAPSDAHGPHRPRRSEFPAAGLVVSR
jgi:hypothetical protein